MITRRYDQNGYKLKAMTEYELPFVSFDLDPANFDGKSQTYDVTNSSEGMFIELFILMEERLNITATLHNRKDQEWGGVILQPNGTSTTTGMFKSLQTGFAEMIVARYF